MAETLITLQGSLYQETDVSRQKIGAHEPESHFIIHISFLILVNDTLIDLYIYREIHYNIDLYTYREIHYNIG